MALTVLLLVPAIAQLFLAPAAPLAAQPAPPYPEQTAIAGALPLKLPAPPARTGPSIAAATSAGLVLGLAFVVRRRVAIFTHFTSDHKPFKDSRPFGDAGKELIMPDRIETLQSPPDVRRVHLPSRREVITFAPGGLMAIPQVARAAPPPGSVGARLEELKTLGTRVEQSGKAEMPEFWPGRLQGKAPPTPKVALTSAPPMVILPGFGNDQVDYISPNGLPEEVGLKATLARRGVREVSVVPINRVDWINVARGLGDISFLTGNAKIEGPAFSWYLRSAKETVEKAVQSRSAESGGDSRCVLIGHSAGGWLARALCAAQGDEWVERNVRGIVTLGAPHATPPPGVPDQTRTIADVNRRAPGAYYSSKGVFYVCVSSERVVGDENGDSSAKNGFTAYNLLLGQGAGVKGDGFVPISAAFLDGATQLTLDCYHSGGSADPWAKDDWYGAEANVDAWLGAVKERLTAQVAST